MRNINIIDKDYSLFFPRTSNFLLFGGNFLFSKRLYEIIKRDLDIRRIDYEYDLTTEYFNCIDKYGVNIYIDSSDRICGLINFYSINTLILTSELLLFLKDEYYKNFINLLKSIKNRMNIKFIFISIANPLHVCKKRDEKVELNNTSNIDWYASRVSEVENILNTETDLIYKFSSYYTYLTSSLQINPLHLINDDCDEFDTIDEVHNFSLDLAEDIIDDILLNLNKTGTLYFQSVSKKINLLDFVDKYRNSDAYSYVKNQNRCALNLIYRKKPHEIINNKSVADWRLQLGMRLKDVIPTEIIQNLDMIIPIPETGKYYAQGLAQTINKPYVEAFYKKSEIGRSFDIKDNEKRNKFIISKLGLINDLVNEKSIGIVDEAIFSGSTLKIVIDMLKLTNVKDIYIFIPTPECRSVCSYGMQPNRLLLSQKFSRDELSEYFGVKSVIFQNESTFNNIIVDTNHELCCFSSKIK